MYMRALAPVLLSTLLAACGGGGDAKVVTPPVTPPATQSLTLSGNTNKIVQGGGAVALSAAPAVSVTLSWKLEQGPGTLSATSGNNVSYTPPAEPDIHSQYVIISVKAGDVTQYFSFWVYAPPGTPGLSLITGTAGSAGRLDGKGDAARFSEISGISADASGNLWLIDTLHSYSDTATAGTRIRRVSASGEVSTVGAVPAAFGGTASSISAAADGSALLLVRVSGGLAVASIKTDGSITQVLAPANTDQSALRVVAGLNGNIYLLGTRHIAVVRADGSSGVLAGNGADTTSACRDGNGGEARLSRINDAVLDRAGNLLVADCYSVRKITPAGVVSTLAGDLSDSGAARDGSGKAAHFYGWQGSLAIDPSGELRVLDYDFPKFNDDGSGQPVAWGLRKVSSSGAVTTLLSGTQPGSGGFKLNFGQQTIAGAAGAYQFVRYRANGSVVLATPGQLYQLDGSTLNPLAGNEGDIQQAVTGAAALARIVQPQALGNSADGTLYVIDRQDNFYKITRDGQVSWIVDGHGGTTLPPPTQLLARSDGLYVNHVQQPNPNDRSRSGGALIELRRSMDFYMAATVLAGSIQPVPYSAPRVDGPGKSATFWKADLLGFDSANNLYVEDEQEQKPLYRKIAQDGTVSTVATLPADLGTNGPGNSANQDGYRYVYDMSVGLVYRVSAAGERSVVAGTVGQYGNRLGALPGSLVGVPYGASSAPTVPLTPFSLRSYAFISGGAIVQLVVPPAAN